MASNSEMATESKTGNVVEAVTYFQDIIQPFALKRKTNEC
jgi:hypothetical protein